MDVLQSNPYGRLTADRLVAFETVLGCRLPEDYRAFLSAHNGGRFGEATFRISASEGETSIHHVYGLHDGPNHARLDWTRTAYLGRMPSGLLPVADDAFGNAICIGLVGNARGRIYFWDHEGEAAEGAKEYWENVTEVAESWPTFVGTLRADTHETGAA